MATMFPIFEEAERLPMPPHNGTDGSRAGAIKAAPHAGTEAAEILAILRAHPQGLRREEVERISLYAVNVVTARLNELVKKQLAVKLDWFQTDEANRERLHRAWTGVMVAVWRAV